MTELTKERVEELRKYIEDAFGEWGQDRPIAARVKADLLAALSDYSALKAFKDNLMKDGHANLVRVATHRDALKVENERLRERAATLEIDVYARTGRLEKAEAQLAKQAPLIEAVMGANEFGIHWTMEGKGWDDGVDAILRAALKLREEKGK